MAAVALAMVGAACGLLRQPPAEIVGVERIEDDPFAVFVLYAGCDSSTGWSVTESEDSVAISLGGVDAGCDAIQGTRVELSDPLGDRRIIDESTGEGVPVSVPD